MASIRLQCHNNNNNNNNNNNISNNNNNNSNSKKGLLNVCFRTRVKYMFT